MSKKKASGKAPNFGKGAPMGFAKGGSIDGIAKKGKTNCQYPKMAKGGKC